ncbi:MAG TPA: hypothetical protein VFX74_05690, partial [Candidatus Limnocylindria bacterium]|nr:hypothetical protein [Candidatus Limnocylindria bacterium]
YWQAAAASLNAEFVELSDRIWEVRQGAARTRIANDLVELDDPVILAIAGDKALCYRLAADLDIPVPRHRLFARRDLRAIRRWIAADGHPFVIKPQRNTSSGVGVTVGVQSVTETLQAVARAGLRDSQIIVERMVPGETCRLLFLGGEMIHAVRRRGVRITPDGRSSVGDLLAAAGMGRLAYDRVTRLTLSALDLTPASVPPAGDAIVVRVLPDQETSTRELRTAYDEEITSIVGTELVDEVGKLVRLIGSEWAGVDIVTNDPSRSLRDTGGSLLEVNTTPGLHHHCGMSGSEPCDIAVRVLDRALSRQHRVRPG